ncbi:4Fe-4S dicluster domain-containing protein [Lachnospiraceae bacterium OttesenSCG-928-D06]|nr:4Fe-4S dicluster domain-containing protein [Lachnospiraceae bacterium OttesenSCG-928-D06]
MTVEELGTIIKENGIVGAGGAGFPTYMKIDQRADTILLNCAECEPLLKLHRQLLKRYAREILETFSKIAEVVGAREAIIGIKEEYEDTIEALNAYLPSYPKVRLHFLSGAYPMGDEVVLIYETVGKVISPGGLPIEAGIAVFNVETVYNIYKAVEKKQPVTDKLVTVVGQVVNPVTVRVPLGTSFEEVVSMAGGEDEKDVVYLIGGPMMGRIGSRYEQVSKTTNAILVLPKDHIIIRKKQMSVSNGMKRAASACCQCQMCTDLCPRRNLGHPIEPHRFMRAASNHDFQDVEAFMSLFFCSSCGLCEMYACPQSLSPRTLMAECKDGMRKNGIKPPKGAEAVPVRESREYRKVPEKRLEARLGLTKYESSAPLSDTLQSVTKVQLLFSQHIGAPAKCVVKKGEKVTVGQVVAEAAEGLSVPIHASIAGVVTDVTEKYVEIGQ